MLSIEWCKCCRILWFPVCFVTRCSWLFSGRLAHFSPIWLALNLVWCPIQPLAKEWSPNLQFNYCEQGQPLVGEFRLHHFNFAAQLCTCQLNKESGYHVLWDCFLFKELRKNNRHSKNYCFQEIASIHLKGTGLDQKNWWGLFGKSDPFLTFYRANEDNRWDL